jgi:hypothetical protein
VSAWYNGVPHVFYVTLRDVTPGDELLLDYGEQHRTQMAEAYVRCKSILVGTGSPTVLTHIVLFRDASFHRIAKHACCRFVLVWP